MAKFRAVKRKFKFKLKYILYLLLIYIGYSFTFYFLSSRYIDIDNGEFIKYMLSDGNHNLIYKYSKTNFINKTLSYLSDVDITNPVSILDSNFYVDNNISSDEDLENLEELKKVSQYIEDPFISDVDKPIVYLYSTHQLENYSSKNLEAYNITPNVMMASYILREKLNDMGINTIVEEGDVTSVLSKNGWNYAKSYKVTRSFLEDIVLKEPTLEYFIDVHRDSVSKKSTTLTVGDISYAKVLFVVGLENPNYGPNLNFAKKISSMINERVKGLSKGVLTKQGAGVNGVYNQDFSPNTLLLELGGVDNTIDEVNNTIQIVSEVITKYIKENSNG